MIVTGFDRRDFIGFALESVRRQKTVASNVDVIVSTNFEDPRLSEMCEKEGWTRLISHEPRAGAQVAAAIKEADGTVLAFLDDDDVWSEGKLRRVEALFRETPDLEYYNHTHIPIDESGVPIIWSRRRNRRYLRAQSDGSVLSFDPAMATQRFVDRVMRSNPGNNSSIAVSRQLVDDFNDVLPGVLLSIDHFFLVAALLSARRSLVERVPLTMWRVHRGNKSSIWTTNFEGFLSSVERTARRIGHDNALFLEMSRHRGANGVSDYLAHKVAALNALADIMAEPIPTAFPRDAFLKTLGSWGATGYHDYWEHVLVAILGLAAVSPVFGRVAAYTYIQNQYMR